MTKEKIIESVSAQNGIITELGFSEKCIPMYGVGTYDLMLGEYDMGGNVLFYYTIQPHDQKIQFYKMAYYNKQFSFLSVLVPSPLSINNSNLLPIFQGTNFLPKKCFVLLKYLKSNLVLSLFQYVNLLSGRIK